MGFCIETKTAVITFAQLPNKKRPSIVVRFKDDKEHMNYVVGSLYDMEKLEEAFSSDIEEVT